MDIWTKKKRSEVMSRIKSKDTKPELILRSSLFKLGFRFRVHRKDLPGKPDIVLPKYHTVIFVHGCFWHYHDNCIEGRIPSTNSLFWETKLERNIANDIKNSELLKLSNWKVIVVWECQINKHLEKTINKIIMELI
jgi:DNA mismatch endonuclease (patch repair protein)